MEFRIMVLNTPCFAISPFSVCWLHRLVVSSVRRLWFRRLYRMSSGGGLLHPPSGSLGVRSAWQNQPLPTFAFASPPYLLPRSGSMHAVPTSLRSQFSKRHSRPADISSLSIYLLYTFALSATTIPHRQFFICIYALGTRLEKRENGDGVLLLGISITMGGWMAFALFGRFISSGCH
jgi:hypothetical protein